jgi:hypothetical protein
LGLKKSKKAPNGTQIAHSLEKAMIDREILSLFSGNSCRDIYKTSKTLDHKSIQTTMIYLSKDLGIIFNDVLIY